MCRESRMRCIRWTWRDKYSPGRCESVPGSNACVRRVARDGHPGLARSRDSTAQCCGQNFLGFRYRASPRKPVICRPWQIPLDVYVSPVFFTPRPISSGSRLARCASCSARRPVTACCSPLSQIALECRRPVSTTPDYDAKRRRTPFRAALSESEG